MTGPPPSWQVDFHALRVTFTTLAVKAGADIRTEQVPAHHSTPQLTLNVFAKARSERQVDAMGKVGLAIRHASIVSGASRDTSTERQVREVGCDEEAA